MNKIKQQIKPNIYFLLAGVFLAFWFPLARVLNIDSSLKLFNDLWSANIAFLPIILGSVFIALFFRPMIQEGILRKYILLAVGVAYFMFASVITTWSVFFNLW